MLITESEDNGIREYADLALWILAIRGIQGSG
jgi:hypothetical protein